jgi:hypothetical protein
LKKFRNNGAKKVNLASNGCVNGLVNSENSRRSEMSLIQTLLEERKRFIEFVQMIQNNEVWPWNQVSGSDQLIGSYTIKEEQDTET